MEYEACRLDRFALHSWGYVHETRWNVRGSGVGKHKQERRGGGNRRVEGNKKVGWGKRRGKREEEESSKKREMVV